MLVRYIDTYYVESIDEYFYRYQGNFSYNDRFIRLEVSLWLFENISTDEYSFHVKRLQIDGRLYTTIVTFIFHNEESAIAFKLRWI